MHLWVVAIKMGGVTEFALEVAGYRLLELLAKDAGEIFGDKTFNS